MSRELRKAHNEMGISQGVRSIQGYELALLKKLLSRRFPGAPTLVGQLDYIQVETLDRDGSFRIFVDKAKASPAKIDYRIPVEARYEDFDKVDVHVLLHVVDGYLSELEIYRDDSGPTELSPFAVVSLRFETARSV